MSDVTRHSCQSSNAAEAATNIKCKWGKAHPVDRLWHHNSLKQHHYTRNIWMKGNFMRREMQRQRNYSADIFNTCRPHITTNSISSEWTQLKYKIHCYTRRTYQHSVDWPFVKHRHSSMIYTRLVITPFVFVYLRRLKKTPTSVM